MLTKVFLEDIQLGDDNNIGNLQDSIIPLIQQECSSSYTKKLLALEEDTQKNNMIFDIEHKIPQISHKTIGHPHIKQPPINKTSPYKKEFYLNLPFKMLPFLHQRKDLNSENIDAVINNLDGWFDASLCERHVQVQAFGFPK